MLESSIMWRLLIAILLLSATAVQAQTVTVPPDDGSYWTMDIPEAIVIGRPIKKIGEQYTELDSLVLREAIVYAMAEVLSQNTSLFIKQYGRATLSTVSFRGTSPSHTQVTWNGMKINSPMLGMVDFSMIPSYFIDDATLLHGTSSVNVTGGGLGGAITLATKPAREQGFGLQYIQGVGSFKTTDEFLRLTYGNKHWQSSTRVVYSSSPNEFKYKNYNKKINIYDEDHNIIDSYYPIERNKSGDFSDLHILQEVYYNTGQGSKLGLSAWYLNSQRGVPMLNVDHKDDAEFTNEQREQTFRGVLSWDKWTEKLKLGAKVGYIYTGLTYDYSRDLGNGNYAQMILSRSYVNTLYGSLNSDYYLNEKWMFTANISAHQHFVESQDKNIITQSGHKAVVGYDQSRTEFSGFLSVKWQATQRLGLAISLREDMYGQDWSPIIPAGFFDYKISTVGNVMAKASISRNYRFPTLNDLYFLPGGNPELKKEQGFTYDCGISFSVGKGSKYSLNGEVTWFDSYINDWIVWLPTFKGFWTPKNVKEVHAYGVEVKAGLKTQLSHDWYLGVDGNFAWTPSINHGDPVNWADVSIGKQLVYIPEYSSALSGRLSWKSWRFSYKWTYYSERFTTSSNEMATKIGRVLPYFISNVSLEKLFAPSWAHISLKVLVNNIFNEEYESVLSRPMPRANFEFFLEVKPKFKGKKVI